MLPPLYRLRCFHHTAVTHYFAAPSFDMSVHLIRCLNITRELIVH